VKKAAMLSSVSIFIVCLTCGLSVTPSVKLGIIFLMSLFLACVGYFYYIGYIKLIRYLRKKRGLNDMDYMDW
jgi:hypothetical protein